jgi:hypothetical protein
MRFEMVSRVSVLSSNGAAMLKTAVAAGAVLLSSFASQSHAAQSVSAPVTNSVSTAPSGAYYEQNGSNVCGTPGGGSSGTTSGPTGTVTICRLQFTAVPSGKTLVIEHVACHLRVGGDVLTEISLATPSSKSDTRLVPLEPTLVSQAIYNYYAVNDDIVYVTRSIPRLVMRSETEAELSMTCQISGHLK